MIEHGKILGDPKDPSAFRNKPVHSWYGNNDSVFLKPSEETNSFREMEALRKQPQEVDTLETALSKSGHTLANVGVSALIVTKIDTTNYVLTVRAFRTDREKPDSVAKLLSGYVPTELITDPIKHLREEVSQELLIARRARNYRRNETFLEGFMDGSKLRNAYIGDLVYDNKWPFELTSGCDFELPDMKKGTIMMGDGNLYSAMEKGLLFHYAADTNSGQIIKPYTLNLKDPHALSFHHSEDKFEKGVLQPKFDRHGILLLRLSKNSTLTGDAYIMQNGMPIPYKKDVQLTEAFAPKVNGISSLGNVPLKQ